MSEDENGSETSNKMIETQLGEVRKGGVAHNQTVDFQVSGSLQQPVIQQVDQAPAPTETPAAPTTPAAPAADGADGGSSQGE